MLQQFLDEFGNPLPDDAGFLDEFGNPLKPAKRPTPPPSPTPSPLPTPPPDGFTDRLREAAHALGITGRSADWLIGSVAKATTPTTPTGRALTGLSEDQAAQLAAGAERMRKGESTFGAEATEFALPEELLATKVSMEGVPQRLVEAGQHVVGLGRAAGRTGLDVIRDPLTYAAGAGLFKKLGPMLGAFTQAAFAVSMGSQIPAELQHVADIYHDEGWSPRATEALANYFLTAGFTATAGKGAVTEGLVARGASRARTAGYKTETTREGVIIKDPSGKPIDTVRNKAAAEHKLGEIGKKLPKGKLPPAPPPDAGADTLGFDPYGRPEPTIGDQGLTDEMRWDYVVPTEKVAGKSKTELFTQEDVAEALKSVEARLKAEAAEVSGKPETEASARIAAEKRAADFDADVAEGLEAARAQGQITKPAAQASTRPRFGVEKTTEIIDDVEVEQWRVVTEDGRPITQPFSSRNQATKLAARWNEAAPNDVVPGRRRSVSRTGTMAVGDTWDPQSGRRARAFELNANLPPGVARVVEVMPDGSVVVEVGPPGPTSKPGAETSGTTGTGTSKGPRPTPQGEPVGGRPPGGSPPQGGGAARQTPPATSNVGPQAQGAQVLQGRIQRGTPEPAAEVKPPPKPTEIPPEQAAPEGVDPEVHASLLALVPALRNRAKTPGGLGYAAGTPPGPKDYRDVTTRFNAIVEGGLTRDINFPSLKGVKPERIANAIEKGDPNDPVYRAAVEDTERQMEEVGLEPTKLTPEPEPQPKKTPVQRAIENLPPEAQQALVELFKADEAPPSKEPPVFRTGEKSAVLDADVQAQAERAGLGRAKMERYPVTRVPEAERAKADADPSYAPREEVVAHIEAPAHSLAEAELARRVKSGDLQAGDELTAPGSQPFTETTARVVEEGRRGLPEPPAEDTVRALENQRRAAEQRGEANRVGGYKLRPHVAGAARAVLDNLRAEGKTEATRQEILLALQKEGLRLGSAAATRIHLAADAVQAELAQANSPVAQAQTVVEGLFGRMQELRGEGVPKFAGFEDFPDAGGRTRVGPGVRESRLNLAEAVREAEGVGGDDRAIALRAATRLVDAAVHEAAHGPKGGHGPEFAARETDLQRALGTERTAAIKSLAEVVERMRERPEEGLTPEGAGVSNEELSRAQGGQVYYKVSRGGEITWQGPKPDPGGRGLRPGEAIVLAQKGKEPIVVNSNGVADSAALDTFRRSQPAQEAAARAVEKLPDPDTLPNDAARAAELEGAVEEALRSMERTKAEPQAQTSLIGPDKALPRPPEPGPTQSEMFRKKDLLAQSERRTTEGREAEGPLFQQERVAAEKADAARQTRLPLSPSQARLYAPQTRLPEHGVEAPLEGWTIRYIDSSSHGSVDWATRTVQIPARAKGTHVVEHELGHIIGDKFMRDNPAEAEAWLAAARRGDTSVVHPETVAWWRRSGEEYSREGWNEASLIDEVVAEELANRGRVKSAADRALKQLEEPAVDAEKLDVLTSELRLDNTEAGQARYNIVSNIRYYLGEGRSLRQAMDLTQESISGDAPEHLAELNWVRDRLHKARQTATPEPPAAVEHRSLDAIRSDLADAYSKGDIEAVRRLSAELRESARSGWNPETGAVGFGGRKAPPKGVKVWRDSKGNVVSVDFDVGELAKTYKKSVIGQIGDTVWMGYMTNLISRINTVSNNTINTGIKAGVGTLVDMALALDPTHRAALQERLRAPALVMGDIMDTFRLIVSSEEPPLLPQGEQLRALEKFGKEHMNVATIRTWSQFASDVTKLEKPTLSDKVFHMMNLAGILLERAETAFQIRVSMAPIVKELGLEPHDYHGLVLKTRNNPGLRERVAGALAQAQGDAHALTYRRGTTKFERDQNYARKLVEVFNGLPGFGKFAVSTAITGQPFVNAFLANSFTDFVESWPGLSHGLKPLGLGSKRVLRAKEYYALEDKAAKGLPLKPQERKLLNEFRDNAMPSKADIRRRAAVGPLILTLGTLYYLSRDDKEDLPSSQLPATPKDEFGEQYVKSPKGGFGGFYPYLELAHLIARKIKGDKVAAEEGKIGPGWHDIITSITQQRGARKGGFEEWIGALREGGESNALVKTLNKVAADLGASLTPSMLLGLRRHTIERAPELRQRGDIPVWSAFKRGAESVTPGLEERAVPRYDPYTGKVKETGGWLPTKSAPIPGTEYPASALQRFMRRHATQLPTSGMLPKQTGEASYDKILFAVWRDLQENGEVPVEAQETVGGTPVGRPRVKYMKVRDLIASDALDERAKSEALQWTLPQWTRFAHSAAKRAVIAGKAKAPLDTEEREIRKAEEREILERLGLTRGLPPPPEGMPLRKWEQEAYAEMARRQE